MNFNCKILGFLALMLGSADAMESNQLQTEHSGFYKHLAQQQGSVEDKIKKAEKYSSYKQSQLNFFKSQIAEMTFELEGDERSKAVAIYNFLEDKQNRAASRLENFIDSFQRSEETSTMKDVDVMGRYSKTKSPTERAEYAGKKYALYESMLEQVKKYPQNELSSNLYLLERMEKWRRSQLEDFAAFFAKAGINEVAHVVQAFVKDVPVYRAYTIQFSEKTNSLGSSSRSFDEISSIKSYTENSVVIRRYYADTAALNVTRSEDTVKLISKDLINQYSNTNPIENLETIYKSEDFGVLSWLNQRCEKWFNRYVIAADSDPIINLTILLSKKVNITEDGIKN